MTCCNCTRSPPHQRQVRMNFNRHPDVMQNGVAVSQQHDVADYGSEIEGSKLERFLLDQGSHPPDNCPARLLSLTMSFSISPISSDVRRIRG
jgi:hypothetical protein